MGQEYGFGIGKAILLGIGVGILLPIVFFFIHQHTTAEEREYVNEGTLTTCTVDSILTVSGKQQVWVYYTNASGKSVKAKAVLNKKVSVGQKVEAYVLESRPDEVFYPASPLIKWIFFGIILIAALASWIPLIVLLRERRIDKMVNQVRAQMKDMNQNDDYYY